MIARPRTFLLDENMPRKVLTSLLKEGIISLFVGTEIIVELKMGNAYLALSLQHCKPFFPLENNDQKVQT